MLERMKRAKYLRSSPKRRCWSKKKKMLLRQMCKLNTENKIRARAYEKSEILTFIAEAPLLV